MAERYFDYLAECILMIGSDENRGLVLSPTKKQNINITNISDFTFYQFQQQILALISSKSAVFPFTKSKPNYPLECFDYKLSNEKSVNSLVKPFKNKSSVTDEISTIHEILSNFNNTNDEFESVRDADLLMSIDRKSNRYGSRRKSIKEIKLDDFKGQLGSISLETIKTFPGMYFNNNLTISNEFQQSKIYILPMTDNYGDRSYAVRMEFYVRYYIESYENKPENSVLNIKLTSSNPSDSSIYVPINIVVFSQFPYFDVLKSILSSYHDKFINDTRNINQHLIELSSLLFRIPVIKSNTLSVNFTLANKHFSIPKLDTTFQQIINWNFSHIFDTLSIENIVTILMAMFQEQKMVFLSNTPNLTTFICETLFVLFKPFNWNHFYLTDLPSHLFEFLDAIIPFILGVPRKVKNLLRNYDDIIIIDLVSNEIEIRPECQFKMPANDLLDDLVSDLNLINHKRYEYISMIDFNDPKEQYEYFDRINHEIAQISMESFSNFMVALFIEILQQISIEKKETNIIFNPDKYLNSSHKNVEFFKLIHRSNTFNCFLDEVFNNKVENNWVKMCRKKYPDELNRLFDMVNKKRESLSQMVREKISSSETITIPLDEQSRKYYFRNFHTQIRKIQDDIERSKLMGEYYFQCQDQIKGLEEFYKLLKSNPDHVNSRRIRRIIRKVGNKKLNKFSHLFNNNELMRLVNYVERRPTIDLHKPPNVEQFNLPNIPIPRSEFHSICKQAKIADHSVTIDNLYACLTIDQKSSKLTEVPVDIFRCFYHYWISSEANNNLMDMHESTEMGYFHEEMIKKTEDSIRVDNCGQGRIILTQYRLLFMPYGSKYTQVLVDFVKDILTKVKVDRKLRSFGKWAEIVEITKSTGEKLLIWFRNEVEYWYQLILEIYNGNYLAIHEKDGSIVTQLTENCNIIDNLICCSRIKQFYKKYLPEMIKKMLIFTYLSQIYNNNAYKNEHRHYLVKRLTPSPQLSPISIDSIIVVPNKLITSSMRFWCACSYDEIKYFIRIQQMTTDYYSLNLKDHTEESGGGLCREIEMTTRISSMVYIRETNQVIGFGWDTTIYVFNAQDCVIEREVNVGVEANNYAICSLYDHQFNSVYFGTVMGQVYQWKTDWSNVQQINGLPAGIQVICLISYSNSKLIGASVYKLHVIDKTRGKLSYDVQVSNLSHIINRISSIQLLNEKLLGVCFSRLPVLYLYSFEKEEMPECIFKFNLASKKEFIPREMTDHFEVASKYIGISSVVPVLINKSDISALNLINKSGLKLPISSSSKFKSFIANATKISSKNAGNKIIIWWVFFRNGLVEIIDPLTMGLLSTFTVHNSSVRSTLQIRTSDINLEQNSMFLDDTTDFLVTVGRDDEKVKVWKCTKINK